MIPAPVPNQKPAMLRGKMHYLLAYDGSEHAQAAIQLLLDLPCACSIPPEHCSVTLMSVLPTQWIGGHEQIQAGLNKEQQRLTEAGMQVETILIAGNPAATLNAHAEEIQADLMLIGAKGLRATLGILLGGVAQQVVEYSTCPVLVVRAPYHGLKRILLVTDGSEQSKQAITYLAPPCPDGTRRRCSWLPQDALVCTMHVLPPPFPDGAITPAWALGPEVLYPTPYTPIDKKAVEAEEERQAERLLNETQQLLSLANLQTSTVLVRGDAATEIIQYIQSNEIDMVVCGSRGLSAVSGWLLGSVSRKLVHYAGCSVLIVK
jgi:nucleotide-binding universal stress UspA family protein